MVNATASFRVDKYQVSPSSMLRAYLPAMTARLPSAAPSGTLG
jgi:hypothetical protein